jgi:hypothetical protein
MRTGTPYRLFIFDEEDRPVVNKPCSELQASFQSCYGLLVFLLTHTGNSSQSRL